ncbi:ATP-binding cassette domain-containing protein [Trichloromonas sp.]|uniref:ATP-binding cassette domain-containing protein n=1 Tax=Trichloromonas sp. TaxID=3069249 RepID=UPI003D819928
MQPIYSLHHIVKKHASRPVLDIEQMELYPGRSYALLGPNGAGKSTLLELLALLAPPCAGTLQFAGETVRWNNRALRYQRGRITLVHQAPYLFNRSVFDNLAFGLGLRGIHGASQRQTIAAALEKVGLDGFAARHARRLSGGEAQRVALARALVLKPEVLLLDEPTASIHSETVPALERVIGELRDAGTTLVVATHDRGQAARLQCLPLTLENGRLATPDLHSPQPGVPLLSGIGRSPSGHCCAA